MKHIKFLPVIVLSLLVIVFSFKIFNHEEDPVIKSVLINKKIPALKLQLLNSNVNTDINKILEGKAVLINIFASWCVPCRIEHEVFEKISNENILILGIAYKDQAKNVNNFLNELGNPYNIVAMDQDGRLSLDLGVYGVPETFLVDKTGIIKYRHVGLLTYDTYKQIITPLLRN